MRNQSSTVVKGVKANMKKIFSVILILAMILSVSPVYAIRGYQSYWIECEAAYTLHSGQFKASADAKASGKGALKLDFGGEEPALVDINFTLGKKDMYDVYLISLPISANWSSFTYYKVNDEDDDKYTNAFLSQTSAYTESSRGCPMYFYKLTQRELDRGRNKITFSVPKLRTLDGAFMLSYLDAVIIVPSEWNWEPVDINTKPFDKRTVKLKCSGGEIETKTVEKRGTVKCSADFSSTSKAAGNPKVYASIVKNGEVISTNKKNASRPIKQWAIGANYRENFEIPVPFCLSDGVYDIVAGVDGIDLEDGSTAAKIGQITVGNAGEVNFYTAKITDVNMPSSAEKGGALSFEADVNLTAEEKANMYVSLWRDGLLYGVVETSVKAENGKVSASGKIDKDLPAGTYTAKVGVHHYESYSDEKEIEIGGNETGKEKYYKPMSYGNYLSRKYGSCSFWYINQEGAAIWDGEPYIPMGGMFCSQFIRGFDPKNEQQNLANFEADKADLDKLRSLGIRDLYVNPVAAAYNVPSYAWEYFYDYIESQGWRYGVQLGGMNRVDYAVYTPKAANDRLKADNVTEAGTVTIESGYYTYTHKQDISCTYLVVDDETGEAESMGKGKLSTTMDNKLKYEADIKLKDGGSHTVYFIPHYTVSQIVDYNYWTEWDKNVEIVRNYSQNLNFGRNFRLVVDPINNEMGFYNNAEGSRIYDSVFNDLYKGWLEKKYKTIDKLREAWLVEAESFDEASRLVPIYTEDAKENGISYTYSFDGDNPEKIYKADTHKSLLWNDYLMGRDQLFAEFNNDIANALKTGIDVPVIYKHCSIQREYFINRELVGGFDGVGSETYGTPEVTTARAATTSAIADQYARTAWRIITETNTEEAVMMKYESGEWSYPSEERFNKHFDSMFAAGMKGGFNFLLANRFDAGGVIGKTYSTIENEKEWPWWQPYLNKHEARLNKLASQKYEGGRYYFYPSQKNWWFGNSERKVVQLADDYIPVQRWMMQDGTNAMQTDDPTVEADILFVNLQNGPYSMIFGPTLEDTLGYTDRKTVVIGFREDIGTIPSIDKYYTDEKVKLSDSENVQILEPTGTSEVLLSTPDGKPYALKDGNLYIIATSNLFDIDGEFYTFKYENLLK